MAMRFSRALFPLVWQLGMFDVVEPGGWSDESEQSRSCPEIDILHEQNIDLCCLKPLAFEGGGVCHTA